MSPVSAGTTRPSQGGTRVLLVKPGDILLIGNVGQYAYGKEARADLAEALAQMGETLEKIGILAFMFAGDIELDKVPGLAERIAAEHDPATCTTCAAARREPSDPGTAHP